MMSTADTWETEESATQSQYTKRKAPFGAFLIFRTYCVFRHEIPFALLFKWNDLNLA